MKLVNFVRTDDGSLVPGESAKLCVTKLDPPAPIAEPAIARPDLTGGEEHHAHEPAASPEKPAPEKPAPIRQHAGGLMIFSDKKTRRAGVQSRRRCRSRVCGSHPQVRTDHQDPGRDYVTVAGWSLLPALKSRYSVLVTLAGYEASLADEVEAAVAPITGDIRRDLQFTAYAMIRKHADGKVDESRNLAIVERRVNDRKRRRAEAAAAQAA